MNSKQKTIISSVAIVAVIGSVAFYALQQQPEQEAPVQASIPSPASTPQMAVLPEAAMKAPPAAATKPQAKPKPVNEGDEEVLSKPDDNPNFDTFNDRYQHIVARRAGMDFDPNELYQAMQEPDTWKPSAEAPESYDLDEEKKNDGRVFISLSPMKLETMARGDKMQITIPNTDIDFTATINEVRSDNSGTSVTWEGTSDEPNSNNKITITKGDTLVVGGIFTDDGLYQLEVKDGQGYIVSNATLFRHGSDQVIEVPQHLIDNPPDEYVELEAETFGG